MMYEYDEGGRSLGRTIAAVVAAAVLVGGLGWFLLVRDSGSGSGGRAATAPLDSLSQEPSASTPVTTVAATTTNSVPVPSTTVRPITSAPPDAPTTTTTTTTPSRPRPSRPTTTTTAPAVAGAYDALPDGSPVPVVAIFDVEQVTLLGAVPSEASAERLRTLAIANSKFPNATIADFLTVNAAVPGNVGVRVVELTSARFPTSSSEVVPDHALELDRVVTVMNALPNTTVLVVGHADQLGDEAANHALSAARAQAVVDYLVSRGIAADRLSSRAVGEADLLTLANDAAALALNRRTEFVFYGLLR
jgi:outer membrane protein OmpA-like peptidoglycan-associated protein